MLEQSLQNKVSITELTLSNKIKIGKVLAPFGIKGVFKFYYFSKDEETIRAYKSFVICEKNFEIENIAWHKGIPNIKLKGIENREDLAPLIGKDVYVFEEDLPELGEDEYYVKDLIGMSIFFVNQKISGVVKDILHIKGTDHFEIKLETKTITIPFKKQFIDKIDFDEKKITIIITDDYL